MLVSGGSVVVGAIVVGCGGRVVGGGSVVGGNKMSIVTGGHISAAATGRAGVVARVEPCDQGGAINRAAIRLPNIATTLHAGIRFGTRSDTGTFVRHDVLQSAPFQPVRASDPCAGGM